MIKQLSQLLQYSTYLRLQWEHQRQSPSVELTLVGHKGRVCSVAFINETQVISAATDCTLKVWDFQTGRVITLLGVGGSLQCVAVARQGNHALIVAGDASGALYCLELVEPGKDDKMIG